MLYHIPPLMYARVRATVRVLYHIPPLMYARVRATVSDIDAGEVRRAVGVEDRAVTRTEL